MKNRRCQGIDCRKKYRFLAIDSACLKLFIVCAPALSPFCGGKIQIGGKGAKCE
jgi:hypothetical protein